MNTDNVKRVLRSIQKIPHRHFVLHGSMRRSNTLIPHRPLLEKFKNPRKAKALRKKAVYATRVVHIAVIYATMPNDTQWKWKRKEKNFRILHREKNPVLCSGYIHVCRATSFGRGAAITSSKRPVKVVKTFRIPPDVFLHLWDNKEIQLFDHL